MAERPAATVGSRFWETWEMMANLLMMVLQVS